MTTRAMQPMSWCLGGSYVIINITNSACMGMVCPMRGREEERERGREGERERV